MPENDAWENDIPTGTRDSYETSYNLDEVAPERINDGWGEDLTGFRRAGAPPEQDLLRRQEEVPEPETSEAGDTGSYHHERP